MMMMMMMMMMMLMMMMMMINNSNNDSKPNNNIVQASANTVQSAYTAHKESAHYFQQFSRIGLRTASARPVTLVPVSHTLVFY